MRWIRKLFIMLRRLSPPSKLAFKLGVGLMVCFYIVGFASRLSAPYVPNYFNAMALYRGCLEAAPASLASGICAGLLGDMILRGGNNRHEDE